LPCCSYLYLIKNKKSKLKQRPLAAIVMVMNERVAQARELEK